MRIPGAQPPPAEPQQIPHSLEQQQFQYLRPRNPALAPVSFAQTSSLSASRGFGLDSPIDHDEDEGGGRIASTTIRHYPSEPMDDLDSPLGANDAALDVPSFHPTGEDDPDGEGDGTAAAQGADSDRSRGWSESGESDSEESVSASDGAWYGGHGRASTNSSVASRMVNLDEEISLQETQNEQARHAAKQEERRRQKKMQEQNAGMPCPPMCGVSWSVNILLAPGPQI